MSQIPYILAAIDGINFIFFTYHVILKIWSLKIHNSTMSGQCNSIVISYPAYVIKYIHKQMYWCAIHDIRKEGIHVHSEYMT